MTTTWTIQHLESLLAKGQIKGFDANDYKQKKQSKYRNKKTEVDGIPFDSVKEANRYKELRLLLKAGEIAFLELQAPFELNPGGTHSLKYISDFIYVISNTGEKVVEDVKGFRTREYQKKRRLMKKVRNIEIKEI